MRPIVFLIAAFSIMLHGQPRKYADGPYVFEADSLQYVLYTQAEGQKITPKMMEMKPPVKTLTVYTDNTTTIDSFTVQLHTPKPSLSNYKEPSSLFAISDIEGNFEAFWKMLLAGNVINDKGAWTFGTGHLVLLGDFMDRGDEVTQCLWLAYELERQAELAGGKVHFVVGNHENMNMRGRDSYVRIKYLELARLLEIEHKKLWGKNTVLGAWMRTKNCIVKIGNTVYLHGGISPELAQEKLSFEQINTIAKKYYGYKHAKEIKEAYPIFSSSTGPLWYRGYFRNPISQKQLNKISSFFDADHIVVGHTIQTKIKTYYKNKVIAIDTPHKKNLTKNKLQALLKHNNRFYTLNQNGEKIILF